MHTYINTYIHTYIHACMHTYIHTYIHTHTYTYIHTNIHWLCWGRRPRRLAATTGPRRWSSSTKRRRRCSRLGETDLPVSALARRCHREPAELQGHLRQGRVHRLTTSPAHARGVSAGAGRSKAGTCQGVGGSTADAKAAVGAGSLSTRAMRNKLRRPAQAQQ